MNFAIKTIDLKGIANVNMIPLNYAFFGRVLGNFYREGYHKSAMGWVTIIDVIFFCFEKGKADLAVPLKTNDNGRMPLHLKPKCYYKIIMSIYVNPTNRKKK